MRPPGCRLPDRATKRFWNLSQEPLGSRRAAKHPLRAASVTARPCETFMLSSDSASGFELGGNSIPRRRVPSGRRRLCARRRSPTGAGRRLRGAARPGFLGEQNAAIVGRYSFRPIGRWVSEQVCDTGAADPPQLWIIEDDKRGPRPPERFEFDAAQVRLKLTEIARHTALAKFRFGTPGYDRWAVVYGRVERAKATTPGKPPPTW
jgi:hypothetical protein